MPPPDWRGGTIQGRRSGGPRPCDIRPARAAARHRIGRVIRAGCEMVGLGREDRLFVCARGARAARRTCALAALLAVLAALAVLAIRPAAASAADAPNPGAN